MTMEEEVQVDSGVCRLTINFHDRVHAATAGPSVVRDCHTLTDPAHPECGWLSHDDHLRRWRSDCHTTPSYSCYYWYFDSGATSVAGRAVGCGAYERAAAYRTLCSSSVQNATCREQHCPSDSDSI
eukprot:COSAG06_NODE_2031_length_7795_cov_114.657225_9_plen_126_part_00